MYGSGVLINTGVFVESKDEGAVYIPARILTKRSGYDYYEISCIMD
jgi:hypothetical protein